MTEKICGKCGTFVRAGRYCPECGQQLYPDVGQTTWIDSDDKNTRTLKLCNKPNYNVWTGEKEES